MPGTGRTFLQFPVISEEQVEVAQEILIEHAGQEYRLRITRQGKLILTK
ncbi:MAG: hemin uptake protein HemP [Nitratireductor sp.]|nr:hemin uptake protein HemP [Nitratireductor sp.]